jgi:hypothetical protein
MIRKFSFFILVIILSCNKSTDLRFETSSWAEADQVFRQDPFWVGADDAYSIPVVKEKTIWLFADTGIDTIGNHSRNSATMIRNSIAIQNGTNPTSANLTYYWRKDNQGNPSSFFPENGNDWYWPGHGIYVNNKLFIFLMRVRSIDTGLGFELYDWDVVLIRNHEDHPLEWKLKWLDIPRNHYRIVIGSASILKNDNYIYAFNSHEGLPGHPIYITRWPLREFVNENLNGVEWWDRSANSWIRQSQLDSIPEPIYVDGQTEFTVHYEKRINKFLCIQTLEFGASNLYYRTSESLTGPWSDPIKLFEPPDKTKPNIMIYAAKAHPQLTGSDLVLTYATNTFQFSDLFSDTLIYYPRFVKLNFVND